MMLKEAVTTTFHIFSHLPGVLKKNRKILKSVQTAGVNLVRSVNTNFPSLSDLYTFRNTKFKSYLQFLNFCM